MKIKRISALLLCAVLTVLVFAGCSKDGEKETAKKTTQAAQTEASDVMETVLEPSEYVLYQNIFYNDQGGDFDGKSVTKRGTFTVLYDRYSGVERYYVWGYNDQTKCCDWQWEIKADDTSSLPSNGSLVKVTGTFVSDENALDGYWITSPQITVEKAYNGADADVDMTTMSGTLERVQIINLQQHADYFDGKTVRAYGRVMNPTTLQHPYYDGAFEQPIEAKNEVPAIGTVVIVSGTVKDGKIVDATVEETDKY